MVIYAVQTGDWGVEEVERNDPFRRGLQAIECLQKVPGINPSTRLEVLQKRLCNADLHQNLTRRQSDPDFPWTRLAGQRADNLQHLPCTTLPGELRRLADAGRSHPAAQNPVPYNPLHGC